MKVKTSITLTDELLSQVNEVAGEYRSRSEVIELALRAFIAARARAGRDARELDILNRQADRLNREVVDVLAYQTEP
jgi:metal-responsive CopG/Arc/MetJ family transcriptional regulator